MLKPLHDHADIHRSTHPHTFAEEAFIIVNDALEEVTGKRFSNYKVVVLDNSLALPKHVKNATDCAHLQIQKKSPRQNWREVATVTIYSHKQTPPYYLIQAEISINSKSLLRRRSPYSYGIATAPTTTPHSITRTCKTSLRTGIAGRLKVHSRWNFGL
jgi:hypothetical protein